MIPIVVDAKLTAVAVVGEGRQAVGRLRMLVSHGCVPQAVFAPSPSAELAAEAGAALNRRWPEENDLTALQVLFAGDLAPERAQELARAARSAKVLFNAEDVSAICTFHVPASVRRGRLVLTVSTDGAAPALSRQLAASLRETFGPEWADRVEELGAARSRWRAEGLDGSTISTRTEALIAQKGWLS